MERSLPDTYAIIFYEGRQFEAIIYDQDDVLGYYKEDNQCTGVADKPTRTSSALLDAVSLPPKIEDSREDRSTLPFGHYAGLASVDDAREVVRYWNALSRVNADTLSETLSRLEELGGDGGGKPPFSNPYYRDMSSFDQIIHELTELEDEEFIREAIDPAIAYQKEYGDNDYYNEVLSAIKEAIQEGTFKPWPKQDDGESYQEYWSRVYVYVFEYTARTTTAAKE